MFDFKELHMEHVIDGYVFHSKNSCFLVFLIYWPCLNFNKHVFCKSVMLLFVHNLLNSSLLMSL